MVLFVYFVFVMELVGSCSCCVFIELFVCGDVVGLILWFCFVG